MNTGSSGIRTLVIPPNGILPLDIRGSFLHYVRGVHPVYVTIDQMNEMRLDCGLGTGPMPEPYSVVRFRNEHSERQQVEFWFGDTAFIDTRVDQVESPTEFVGNGEIEIPGNGKIDLNGVPEVNRLRRKCVVVSNLDPATPLYFLNAGGKKVGIVRAGETISHPVSGFVSIKNDTSAAVRAVISEIWWSL